MSSSRTLDMPDDCSRKIYMHGVGECSEVLKMEEITEWKMEFLENVEFGCMLNGEGWHDW